MRAIVMSETGGPEVLEWREIEDPEPGPGEALVTVESAGVNYIDTYHRRGLYPVSFPFVPGVEGAGTVTAVGPGVSWPAVDDRVAWFGRPGAYAEQAVVDVDKLVAIPDGIDAPLAAAVSTQGLTAHYLARDTFRLTAGDTCLIHAGAGGVGRLLIQIARHLGVTVYATVSTEEKAAVARDAGANHVILYTEEDFGEACRRISGKDRPFDVVYDGVGRTTFDTGLSLIRPRGTMALFGQASGPVPPVDPQALNTNGSLFLTRPTLGDYVATRGELEKRMASLFQGIADGWLRIHVGGTWPLAEAAEAHRALESRRTTGKLLLEV
jgi:NADPH2:quinone reductase